MKKTIMTLAVAAASIFCFNSFAQSPRKACCNPYEGLNLTTQQKEKLNKITTPAQSLKENRDKQRADKEKARADRQQKAKQQRENIKNIRANYLKDVRSVLTPEQYIQFLENNYVNGPAFRKDKPKGNKKFSKDRKNCDRKPGKDGKHPAHRKYDTSAS